MKEGWKSVGRGGWTERGVVGRGLGGAGRARGGMRADRAEGEGAGGGEGRVWGGGRGRGEKLIRGGERGGRRQRALGTTGGG